MSEQITLFDEPLTLSTLGDKLEEILEAAREKSGYYKLHKSGMYEMMKGAPASELYDILKLRKNKSGEISFDYDKQLFIKFFVKSGAVNTTQELYRKFLSDLPKEDLNNKQTPKYGARVEMDIIRQVDFFKEAVDYLIRTQKPSHLFACCSRYKECSQAGKCLHEHPYYSKGCYYRENLEHGIIFYK